MHGFILCWYVMPGMCEREDRQRALTWCMCYCTFYGPALCAFEQIVSLNILVMVLRQRDTLLGHMQPLLCSNHETSNCAKAIARQRPIDQQQRCGLGDGCMMQQ
jgi:hypothetical protein